MIEVISKMGDDTTVVNAARVSFAKHVDEFKPSDGRLLRYLLKHNHWTPFAHPQLTLRIKMPIFIARQWFKHMIGFSRNEVSRRYVDSAPEFFVPDVLRQRASNKKQGSMDVGCAQSSYLVQDMIEHNERALTMYNQMIASEVCPEQARMVLPQSMMTEFYETGSLAAYLRLVHLRTEETAQKEVRDYADQVALVLSAVFPETMKAIRALED